MSPAFSNSEPQQFLEAIRALEARLIGLEKVLNPSDPTRPRFEPQKLLQIIARLDTRLASLEKVLDPNGAGFTLGSTDSSITVNRVGVVIKSRDIELIATGKIAVKAAGQLILKGARITEN